MYELETNTVLAFNCSGMYYVTTQNIIYSSLFMNLIIYIETRIRICIIVTDVLILLTIIPLLSTDNERVRL